jgi:two-component system cell cycle sensor histidine kinase/response regulator CckA
MLLGLGYRVLSASSGEEALQVSRGYAEQIDLLLTDVVMPGINGREMAEKLLELRPGLKVLYTSGYSAEIITRHGMLHEGNHLIDKPYTPQQLAKKIRQVLDN